MKLFMFISALFIAVLFSSCAKFPETELTTATAAVDSLKIINADLYVPVEYQAVTDTLAAINVKLEAEKSKFFSSYKDEKSGLEYILVTSAEVKTKSLEVKTEIKNETDSLLTEVKTLVETNKVLLTKAPKGKEGIAALESIQSDLSTIEASITDVETLLSNDNIFEANTKVKAVNELATKINVELTTAIEKVKK